MGKSLKNKLNELSEVRCERIRAEADRLYAEHVKRMELRKALHAQPGEALGELKP